MQNEENLALLNVLRDEGFDQYKIEDIMGHVRTSNDCEEHGWSGEEIKWSGEESKWSGKACAWILKEPAFNRWLSSLPGGILTMFGAMGCGKTVVSSYVAEHLRSQMRDTSTTILSYQIRASLGGAYLDGVYVSLFCQLLSLKPELKVDFVEWYYQINSARRSEVWESNYLLLGQYVEKKISESTNSTNFMILYGLDRMVPQERQTLLKQLQKLLLNNAPLKVFVSSQYREDIDDTLKSFEPNLATRQHHFTMARINMKPDLERDRTLAEHLAARWVSFEEDQAIKSQVVKYISQQAKGSAIWLSDAISYIDYRWANGDGRRSPPPTDAKKYLEWYAATPALGHWYLHLFETKIWHMYRKHGDEDGPPESGPIKRAVRALEALAVARRPLTLDELLFAAIFDEDGSGSKGEWLERLDTAATAFRTSMMHLISPFITVDETTKRIKLVHQSLVELIRAESPLRWGLWLVERYAAAPSDKEKQERLGKLHATMLRKCCRYLMLDDFQKKDLAQILSGSQEFEHMSGFQVDLDEAAANVPNVPAKIDLEAYGLGKFFAYAAVNWLYHFENTPRHLRPEESIIALLCGHKTRCLANWVEIWKRPNSHYVEERTLLDTDELDPLVVMAYVEPTAMTLAFTIREKARHPELFTEWSEWTMLKVLMREGTRHLGVIWGLLKYRIIDTALCHPSGLIWILRMLPSKKSSDPVDWPGSQWEEIFDTLIQKLGSRLEPKAHLTLRVACQTGCLPLVKLLFKAAETWPGLRTNMLSIDRNPSGGLFAHQALGEAAYNGHAEVVQFLCQQEGIEPHLKYVNSCGSNVFHQSARLAQSQILETLIRLWPQGVHEVDKNGETVLTLLVFGNLLQREDSTDTAALKTLLRLGKYNLRLLDGEPMRISVSKENSNICRLFVVEYGADPSRVVEVDSDGVPKLRADRQPARADQGPHVVRGVLKCFCDLMHLTVAGDH